MDVTLAVDTVQVVEVVGLVLAAGWMARRLLYVEDGRWTPVAGVLAFLAGFGLFGLGGWDVGPVIDGLAIVPPFAGALVVTAAFKLVEFGAAVPRW
ncbi:MAG: hypothetical protein U0807_02685 [Candidatus Binatia bacterium]